MENLKKWFLKLFGLLVFLSIVPTVAAEENKINSIHIDVQLQEDGSATIRETREMETYEHTELYIVLENLGETELLDFEVVGFEEEENWDIDNSFEEKANKYGVIDTSDGYELAWGITEYGNPEYHVSYTLSNLVRNLEDGQALFWNFDSFSSLPADRLTMEISAPFPLEEQVLDLYTFGFEGPYSIENGVLKWTGFGLDESTDVIVLLQFPSGTFQTNATEDLTLEEQRMMATEGSSYNDEEPMPNWAKGMLAVIGALFGGGAIGAVSLAVKNSQVKKENNHFYPNDYIKENRGKIAQTPPRLEGDIGRYDYFLSKVVPGGGGFSNYFFAYLLIWSLEERIRIQTVETERFMFGPKTEADLYIQNYEEEVERSQLSFSEYVDLFEMGESTLEEVFWAMILEAADRNGKVLGDDVQEWSEDNAEDISALVTLMEDVSEDWLAQHGYMDEYKKKGWLMDVNIQELTKKGDAFVTSVVKFDNFLNEMDEVSLSEYEDWHELIIWAALFGKAEKTVEYLEEFHPDTWDYLTAHYPYLYGNYYGYHYLYLSHTNGLNAGGYSSTGSGMSSAGGGFGAGGGGGGGSR